MRTHLFIIFIFLVSFLIFVSSIDFKFASSFITLTYYLKNQAMKSFGSILAFTRERNDTLLRAFREQIKVSSHVRLREIVEKIVNSPSPRFWVSEERAAIVVSAIMRGKPVLDSMRPTKREMFIEIHKRVCALKKRYPDWTLGQLVFKVVNSPAPRFYMEPSSAQERLFKIRNGWYENGKTKKHF